MLKMILRTVVLFLFGWLIWRYASPKYKLPCPAWLAWAVERENPFAKYSRSKEIIGGLDLQEGMTVIDAGCGPGRLSLPLARAVGVMGRVISVDVQQKMLDIVQKKAAAEEIYNISLRKMPLGEGRLGDCAADRAVLVAVLGEVPDRDAAMREIYDALKPGGILAVSETVFDPHYQKRQVVDELARMVGFKELEYRGDKLAYTLYLQK